MDWAKVFRKWLAPPQPPRRQPGFEAAGDVAPVRGDEAPLLPVPGMSAGEPDVQWRLERGAP
ncbi:MAG TPA: hypothetical protein VNK91_10510 [Burkholderiaceae bacterium]|nr:hypothetical protein [Burkholderiaceae bacterium]